MEPHGGVLRLRAVEGAIAIADRPREASEYTLGDSIGAVSEPGALGFADFYTAHHATIARALALTLGDAELGGEAADEAMTRAYQRWHSVSTYRNPPGWVYRVGLNWARSFLRRGRRTTSSPYVGDLPVDDPTPRDPALVTALGALDPKHRSVVVLRYLMDWSVEDTAESAQDRARHRQEPTAPRTSATRRQIRRRNLMNLDDQIRRELRERASSIDVQAAGPRSIINAARDRTRRARIAGGVAAFALVVGVGSVALAVRDGGDSQDDTTVAAVGGEPAPESAGASDSAAPSATDSGTTGNQETEALEVAATEQDPGPEQAAPSEDDAPQPPAEASTPDSTATLRSLELVAHEAGFIAIRNDRDNGFGATLWSTTDGLEWTPISDPKPTAQASITAIVSDDGLPLRCRRADRGRGISPLGRRDV